MTACEPLELEILPPYIGSAVSPTVDITETTDDITVTITDFRGEHAYTVDKTDQAISDAEQAATNADTAAANATSTANAAAQYARTTADQAAADAQATADAAAGRADTAAGGANQAAQAATQAAGTANTAASNADTKAALADSKAALANQAATTANQAAQAAEAAKTAANTAAGQATTAAGNANAAAGTANTAATNADAKAALADTAAANADTATANANTATTSATNAAQAANNAADVAIEAAETITDGYFPRMLAGAAESLMDETDTATWAERVSSHDGVARIEAIQGNTVVWNQVAQVRSGTNSGITFTRDVNDDSHLTMSGTLSSSNFFWVAQINQVQGHVFYYKLVTPDISSYSFGSTTPNRDTNTGYLFTAASSSTASLNVVFPEAAQVNIDLHAVICDLTRMFGAGNEPATAEEFEALFPASYYAYDAGSLLNVNMQGVRTVGFNQWDEEWESGLINASGGKSPGEAYIRSKNFINVFPNMEYAFTRPTGYTVYIAEYDIDKNFIVRNAIGINNAYKTFTTTVNTAYIMFCIGGTNTPMTTYNNDICINISDPTRNGTYEPYTTDTREIPVSTYFPDGMKSAGSVHDELTMSKAVKRVGSVDLGTLDWSTASPVSGNTIYVSTLPIADAKPVSQNDKKGNLICSHLATEIASDLANHAKEGVGITTAKNIRVYAAMYEGMTVAAFKTAMSGVMLYYELATSTEVAIDPPLTMTYTVENGGTEQIVIPTGENSAAPTLAIVYGLTADGVVDKALSVIAPIEGATASTNYSVNAYLVHDQQLYRVTSAIATGEAITPGSNCVACTVMGELARLTA